LKEALSLIRELGLFKGLFAVFFIMMHAWVFSLYCGRIKDRQKEIDRLAEDNREYRDRFLKILDEHQNYKRSGRKK
jgi:uncharacterized membrane protein